MTYKSKFWLWSGAYRFTSSWLTFHIVLLQHAALIDCGITEESQFAFKLPSWALQPLHVSLCKSFWWFSWLINFAVFFGVCFWDKVVLISQLSESVEVLSLMKNENTWLLLSGEGCVSHRITLRWKHVLLYQRTDSG